MERASVLNGSPRLTIESPRYCFTSRRITGSRFASWRLAVGRGQRWGGQLDEVERDVVRAQSGGSGNRTGRVGQVAVEGDTPIDPRRELVADDLGAEGVRGVVFERGHVVLGL